MAHVDGNDDGVGYGVRGTSSAARGVWGKSDSGFGVIGECPFHDGVVGVSTTGFGVSGSSQDSAGVAGVSSNTAGVKADSTNGNGVDGTSINGYGGSFSGGLAQLMLWPSNTSGHPTTGNHLRGELFVDNQGHLYFCTHGDGTTPGTWKKVQLV